LPPGVPAVLAAIVIAASIQTFASIFHVRMFPSTSCSLGHRVLWRTNKAAIRGIELTDIHFAHLIIPPFLSFPTRFARGGIFFRLSFASFGDLLSIFHRPPFSNLYGKRTMRGLPFQLPRGHSVCLSHAIVCLTAQASRVFTGPSLQTGVVRFSPESVKLNREL